MKLCLENPMDGGAWWATVHGVAEGQTRPSDFTFTFHSHALESVPGCPGPSLLEDKERDADTGALLGRSQRTAEPS